jgi:beta-glucanase (GH16 family)
MDGYEILLKRLSSLKIRRYRLILGIVAFSIAIAGCGSSSSGVALPVISESFTATNSPTLTIRHAESDPTIEITETEISPTITDSPTPAMKLTLTPTSTHTATATPEPPPNPVGQDGEWTLLFRDEFEAKMLDLEKWTTCYWWGINGCTISSNNELEWYQPENVIVQDGKLLLRAQNKAIQGSDGRNYQYTSGVVTTGRDTSDLSDPTRFSFQYGYAEIRAKIPFGQGFWPAFWLLPDNNTSKPEIDVIEILGHQPETVKMRFHYLDRNGREVVPGNVWVGPDFSADWHTFAIDWQPDVLIWYVDGIERWRFEEAEHIPQQTMYLLLNLAVGGVSPGPPDETTIFPSDYEIDYLRVWRKTGEVYLRPREDAYVDGSSSSTNYGDEDVLYSDGDPTKTAYLKFDTSSIQCDSLSSATLRVRTLAMEGADSPDTHTVRLVADSSWQEDLINYENQPALSDQILGQLREPLSDKVYKIPLDISNLGSLIGTEFTLVIDSNGSDGLYFYAREGESKSPLLVLELDLASCDPNN